jgi:hypothetical protein
MKHKAILALQKDGKVFVCETVVECQFWKLHKDTVGMREIEWETKEPVRVADYLVPFGRHIYDNKIYDKQTHPTGQQPEGSVMVPGSEKDQE